MVRIELASLEGGKGRFSRQYAEGELVLEDERVRFIVQPQVSGEIGKGDPGILVSGRVTARVEVECDRCLKPIEFPVASSFKLEYVTAAEYQTQQDTELSEEDLDLSIFDGEVVDIDALVAEEVLLAIPDHWLCQENCKGLCSKCGADRNATSCGCETAEVDPRWAALKNLVEKENGKL